MQGLVVASKKHGVVVLIGLRGLIIGGNVDEASTLAEQLLSSPSHAGIELSCSVYRMPTKC